jgi:hypothetical protein
MVPTELEALQGVRTLMNGLCVPYICELRSFCGKDVIGEDVKI